MAKQHGLGEEASALSDRVTELDSEDRAGELVDDRALERRGEEQNARGRERQQANQVPGEPDRRYVSKFELNAAWPQVGPMSTSGRAITPAMTSTS